MAPALAVSMGLWLQCGFLLYILASSLKQNAAGTATWSACLPAALSVLRQSAAAALTALAAWQLLELLHGCGIWLGLAVAIAGGAAAWLLCLLALRDGDALAACRALAHRLPGRPHKQ